MKPDPLYFAFISLPCVLCSGAASVLLLLQLRRLSPSVGGTLMARQLWHLGIADLHVAFMFFPWLLHEVWQSLTQAPGQNDSRVLNYVCAVISGNTFPLMPSVLIEVHIAVAMVATAFRHTGATRVLSKSLPLAWPFGLVLAGVITALEGRRWDGHCRAHERGRWLKAGSMAVALVVCITAYVTGVVIVARQHGGSAEHRVRRRASVFIVAAVVTWLPYVIQSFLQHFGTYAHHSIWSVVAFAFLESNGIFNAAGYAWHSGFLRRAQRRTQFIDQNVGPPSVREQNMPPVSLRVAFELVNDVVIVPRETAFANEIAAAETAALRTGPTQEGATAYAAPSGRSQSMTAQDFLACFVLTESNQAIPLDDAQFAQHL